MTIKFVCLNSECFGVRDGIAPWELVAADDRQVSGGCFCGWCSKEMVRSHGTTSPVMRRYFDSLEGVLNHA